MAHTLLIAEDDPVQREMITMLLSKRLGYEVISTANGSEAISRVQSSNAGDIDVVLLDIQMPVMNGFEALSIIRKIRPELPVLMLTSSDNTADAVMAIKEGAYDFIVKPPERTHIDIVIKNAIRFGALSKELSQIKREKAGTLSFTDLIGHSAGLADAVMIGRKAAMSDVPVYITGETGVGKELFARAIHDEGRRAGASFVALNCGAIPENLVESILFGHEKGAFTGANSSTIGKFREADGGTIFLDEVGELSLDAQVKLLRVLQQKEVEPVGSSKTVKINVRIISATNRDLKRDVKEGRFREDLYFRLNVFPVALPPLRDRVQDILPLAEHFIKSLAASDGMRAIPITQDAQHYLEQYQWPGNIRELHNLMHRAIIMSDNGSVDKAMLEQIHTQEELQTQVERRSIPPLHISMRLRDGTFKSMSDIEHEVMQSMLSYFEQNITRTADALGIAKSTFYRKIKELPTSANDTQSDIHE
jgi:DNA-binding NtrC family response regulator